MRLIEHLPENYRASRETVTFQAALQPEVDAIWRARDELLAQLNPNTADWGLDCWEDALGLTADAGRTLEQRRAQVVAKLQIRTPVTVECVRSVCEKILGFAVDVIEHIPDYVLEIDLVGGLGLPPNIDDLIRGLEELLPAHLAWKFTLHYRAHRALRPYTHGGLAAYTHQTIKGGDMTNGAH